MRELAKEARVHPVHLARVFRKIERRTPGEYQQRLQVWVACELLRDPGWPLAAIAAECGFSDQSRFTRIFRRMAGTTPARFRLAVLLARPARGPEQRDASEEKSAPLARSALHAFSEFYCTTRWKVVEFVAAPLPVPEVPMTVTV